MIWYEQLLGKLKGDQFVLQSIKSDPRKLPDKNKPSKVQSIKKLYVKWLNCFLTVCNMPQWPMYNVPTECVCYCFDEKADSYSYVFQLLVLTCNTLSQIWPFFVSCIVYNEALKCG